MRNLLLLFINILVFSSISFSQVISPPNGQNRCQNQPFTCTTDFPYVSYTWSFSGVPFTYVVGFGPTSSSPQIICTGTGSLNISVIVDGTTLTSLITINGQPGVPSYQNGSSFCLSNSTPQTPNAPITAGGTYSVTPFMTNFNTGNGQFIPSQQGLGSYTVTYALPFSSTGCTPVSSLPITISNNTIAPGINRTTCINSAITTITLATTGATGATVTGLPAGVSYSWLNNILTISGTPTTSGTFPYTVTTTGGCPPATTTGTITVTVVPDVTINYGDNTFCSNELPVSPDLPLVGVGAFTGGTYSVIPSDLYIDVNTGEIDPSTSTAGGNYTVSYTIDAAGGCEEVIVDVIVDIYLIPLVSISYASYPFCQSLVLEPVDLTGPSGGTYSPSPFAGLDLDPITGDIRPNLSTPGLYDVYYTINTGNGCNQVIASAQVAITGTPTAFISYPGSPFCTSDSLQQVLIEGGTYYYEDGEYTVNPVGLSIDSNTGEIYPSLSQPGTYIVTYTTPPAGNCAAVSDTTIVKINGAPYVASPFPIGSATFCDGGNVNIHLDAGIGNLFQWYIIQGGSTTAITGESGSIILATGINYNATITGNYFCEVINPIHGCSSISDTTEVTVYDLPSIPTISGNAVFCQGSFTTLASSPAVDYLWSTGAITSNIVVSTAGSYSVTVTNAEGCDSDSDPYTVNMTPLPDPGTSIIYQSQEFCKTLTSPQFVTQNGTPGGTYTANNPGLSINAITGAITPSLSTAGTYTVIYTIAASGGCAELNAITTVEITTAPSATITYTNPPYCQTLGVQPVSQIGQSGGTYSSTSGLIINESTGAITPSESTAGTYTVTYTIEAAGGCTEFTTTTSVTIIAAQSATISYPSSPFCKTLTTAQSVNQIGTTGGTYSATGGLLINASTGAITPSLNSPGAYTVTYFLPVSPSGCSAVSTTASVTITAAPSATITYTNSPYCQTLGLQPVTQNGTPGGTYTSTTGLIINSSTGVITPSTSTPSTYTVTYTIAAAGGCADFTTTTTVKIIAAQSATISYPSSPFCKSLTVATPVSQSGTTGGVYSSTTAGLSINSSTGAIIPSLSQPGTYAVTYFLPVSPNGCSALSTTASVTITAAPSATITYTNSPYCQTLGAVPLVNQTGTIGGTYSSLAGLSIDENTGAITPSTSTAGAYTVTYTIAAAGGCAAYSNTASVTIIAAQSASISYAGSPFCKTLTSAQSVNRVGTPNGTYSSSAGLSISTSTGAITPSSSTAGTYTVTYTNAAAGGCIAASTTTTVIITGTPTATISYPTPFCSTLLSQAVSLLGTYSYSGGTYSFSPPGLSIDILTGVIDPSNSQSGNYIVEYTTLPAFGCAEVSTTATVSITSVPSATISYANSPFCNSISNLQSVTRVGNANGTYSSSPGLSIIPSTGAITPSLSQPGTYTVTYTLAASAGCAAVITTANVTITAAPSASINYANTSYCNTITSVQPVSQTGTTGGTYSSATGLSIDASTGAITPSTSAAGTYTVTYTNAAAGGCIAASTTASVSITTAPTATINYAGSPFCSTLTTAQPVSLGVNSSTGGTYSSTSGLSISASTGAITPSTSTPGTYTVTYTLAASSACAVVITTTSLTITTPPNASINYTSLFFCNTITNSLPVTQTGTSGGTYSAALGLSIIPSTGAITPSLSQPGTYTVTYTLAASAGCAAVIATASVTIKAAPSATISYPSSPWCNTLTVAQEVTQNGTTGGVYSSTTAGLSINSSTGTIALVTSAAGTYTVTYTIAAAGGCSAVSTTTPVTITVAPSATISYANPTWCNTLTIPQEVSLSGTAGGTYSSSTGLSIDPITGDITPNLSTAASYTVTYTIAAATGCAAVSTTTPVMITPAPITSISYSSPFCQTLGVQSVNEPGTTGGTYSSTSGLSINANTGAINPSLSTAGTYIITYTLAASAGCAAVISNPNVTITAAPSASISYSSPFCKTLTSPESVIITGTSGGTYSASPPGLNIESNTGAIIPSTSIAGTYIVTYTLAPTAGCAAVNTTANVTITPVPSATISYVGSPFCQTLLSEVPVIQTGTPGGVYTTITVGLSINSSTGAITPSLSTAGTYPVTYTIAAAGGCSELVATQDITIIAAPSATISYPGSPFCKTLTTAPVTQIGTIGGTYSSTTGLSINATTGAINPSLSTAGTYTVTYTIAATGPCATESTTTSVTITTAPSATISYPSSSFCNTLTTALPVIQTGTTLGTYSSTTGLSINASTGAITPSTSTGGTYTVTYTIAAASGCSAVSTTASVTIIAAPSASISYASLSFCNTITSALAVTLTGTPGGAYSSNASGLSIDQTTGAITPSTSTAGTYIVTYTLPATSPCEVVSTTASVTITTAPIATINYPNSPWCNNLTNEQDVSQTGTQGGTYSSTVGLSINPSTGSITPSTSIAGSYTVTYTIAATGPCELVSTTANVTITAPPSATINYIGSPNPIVLCPGEFINLTAAPSLMTYIWNSPTGPNVTQFLQANTSGSYNVVVTDSVTGCSAASTPISVSIQTLGTTPAAVIGMPSTLTLCPGSLFTLSEITSNATSFNWTLISAPAGCNLIGASTLNPTFTSGSVSGTAILRLNTSLNYACNTVYDSLDITITISPSIPTLSNNINSGLVDQVLCPNIPIDPIIFNVLDILGSGTTIPSVTINGTTVLASTPYYGISWNFIGGQVVISGTPNFGNYIYTVNGIPTGSPSCLLTSLSGTITSQASSLSIFSGQFTNNQIICIGTSIAPIIYNYTGVTIASFDLPDGVIAQSNTSGNQYTISGTPLAVGYYNYAITTGSACGFETLLGEITVIPSITGNTSGTATTTNCDGSEFTLIGGILNSSGNTNYTYLWVYSTSITGPYDPAPGINTNANYEGTIYLANDTLYFRRFVFAGDCEDFSAPVMVHVIPLGTNPNMIAFAGADQTISLGQSVELVTTGVNISEYNWSPTNGLSSSTISNPFASPISTTIYTLTVQDIYGCSYSDDLTVTVLTDYSLTIPSLITPNDDGSNDFWEIPESLFYTGTTVKIINREGQEVYSSSNYDNTWDGTYNGKLLPEATYYYFIQFPNSEITHKGPVTILRNIK